MRTEKRFWRIRRAFRYGCDRFGMRLIAFSVQDFHIHLIVEAVDKRALSRGMQGLTIRLARGINDLLGRRGKVFAERYCARALKTVGQVRATLEHVLKNLQFHRDEHPLYVDPFSTASGEAKWWDEVTRIVVAPTTRLLIRVDALTSRWPRS